jgi:2,4-dichlorophenol 6-monooxygenase
MTTVPVLIVGGGGAGLSASMILSTLGVETLLVSGLPTTSILPKAHVLGQRTMEIFTEVGIADEIYTQGTPQDNLAATGFYAGVRGSNPNAGRLIGKLDLWGAGYRDAEYIDASPCPTANLPQIRLEPVLRTHAEKLNPGRVRFHHELIGLEQDASGVRSTIRDHRTCVNARSPVTARCSSDPTSFIGFRSSGAVDDPLAVVTAALQKILAVDELGARR